MSMRVATNISAINAMRTMGTNNRNISKSFEQLASGSRINRAADDAAGLAISESLNAQIRSATQAKRNANDGISLVQTAEGGLAEIGNIIIRLRELGIQAASDTVGSDERQFINAEVSQLKEEMERIAQTTTWGTTKLLDGSTPQFDFQVGIFNNDFADRISFDASGNVATIDALGLSGIDFSEKVGAQGGLESLDAAQTEVSRIRANLGAIQNRLTNTVSNLGGMEENLSAANSRIRDADMASVTSELTRNQILMQANTATLAQANQKNTLALQLLG
ncbi:MAG: flagellin FliC [Bdellovibrionales bacterium]|nr:flagellin FliC [Bdellovibrionales bacterium]